MMIGTTIETNQQDLLNKISKAPPVVARSAAMSKLHSIGWRTFITIEPIMMFDLDPFAELILQASPDFVNIGADSKQHGLVEPKKTEVDLLIQYLVSKGISIRKKENLGRLS
jgi:DNA repair photolyase